MYQGIDNLHRININRRSDVYVTLPFDRNIVARQRRWTADFDTMYSSNL